MDDQSASQKSFNASQKFFFYFIFIYFLLFIVLENNGAFWFMSILRIPIIFALNPFVLWIGKNVLQLPQEISRAANGSGDTTYDWVIVLVMLVFSFIGSLVSLSLTVNKSINYARLRYWLLVALRYYIGFTMMSYGALKIVKLQFPSLSPESLLEPYGEGSPMGLAWRFMGYSYGYNLFVGIGEFGSGVLLLFRRTTLFGAIAAFAVASNIMMMNYSFDIPVKIISTHLVLMSIFIFMQDYQRLVNFFFLNKSADAAVHYVPSFKEKGERISVVSFKWVMIISTLGLITYKVISNMGKFGDYALKPAYYGIHEVQLFVRNHDTIPQNAGDTARWEKLFINRTGSSTVQMANKKKLYFGLDMDSTKCNWTMTSYRDSKIVFHLNCTNQDSIMELAGNEGSDTLFVRLKTYDLKNFLLMNRGFHWVNEYPYNK